MSHNEALRSESQLSLDTKFRFVICQEHIPISVCLGIPNREKVPLPRNSTNRRCDHSELSEMNTKKTNIKLVLIENLLFIFVTRYFFGCKAYQIT
jgi:hypothetical protein